MHLDGHTCIKCGYDLTGLELGLQCPECNTAVEQSVLGRDERREARTLALWMAAFVASLQILFAGSLVLYRVCAPSSLMGLVATFVFVTSWAMALPAVMLSDDEESSSARRGLRLVALAGIVLPLVILVTFWVL